MTKIRFNTPYLNDYLEMVEDTESPRLFHIWSAISAMSATLGRRCWLPFGPTETFANQFVLLVGSPGTRKSTAAGFARKLVRDGTGIRFGPTDTGNQRQGLIEALVGRRDEKSEESVLRETERMGNDPAADSLMSFIAGSDNTPWTEDEETGEPIQTPAVDALDRHHLFQVAGEFTGLIGEGNMQILQFLTQMWDGDDYQYQTKTGTTNLKNPLMNILGCTTPVSLAHAMPASIGEQGLLSRFILVYGATKYRLVPRPSAPDAAVVQRVRDALNYAYNHLSGPFSESADAADYSDKLYSAPLELTDGRFSHYHERRHTHLRKVAMALAAGRGSSELVKLDYVEADRILRATERGMPEALGEFGLSPLAALKQRVAEFIKDVAAISVEGLQNAFHRDAKATELQQVLLDLSRAGQIMIRQTKSGATIHAAMRKADFEESMLKVLTGEE